MHIRFPARAVRPQPGATAAMSCSFPAPPKTVLEAALEALQSKRFNKISDNAFDRESKRIAGLLPQPNVYPPSLYAAKQVVGAENLQQYEVHTCVNDCVRFEKLARNEFSLHKDDICPICKQPRFEEYETLKGACYRPRKSIIEFGVKKAVQELWADPEFCKARNGGAERDFNGTDFWGGEYAEEINQSVDGLLFKGENGGYELGFDYGQPWKRQKYSLGVVCIRSLDLPGERRSEKRFRKSVAIIPGPKEPKWLWPYFSGALVEFVVAWKKGIELVDSYTRQTVQHHAFLCLVSSDTLARNALLEHVAVAAFLGCGKCWMEGCKYEGCGHGTYFAGYARPAPQKILGGGRGILAKDSRIRTHQEHVRHGTAVEKGLESAEQSGVKGVCSIAKMLPYFSVVKGFPIAVGHAFLLGVVSAFLDTVLADYKTEGERPNHVVTKANRRRMSARHGRLVWTHEHGRPAKDVVKYRASMTMEELLVFVETASLYVFLGCLPKELETAWFHLRRAVMHYCRISDVGMEEARRERARADMAKYASIVEEVIGPQMCTMNLHQAVRHAYEQETATGSTAKSMEWFVEQHVGELKKRVGGMTRDPHKVVGNDVLLEKALIDRVTEKPQFRALVGLDEEKEPEPFKGPTDVLQGGVQLLHVGQPVGSAQLNPDELASLQSHAEAVGFTTDVQRWGIHQFRAARVGDQAYQSRARYRTAARHSFNVTISWSSTRTRKETEHFATLERFFRVEDSASAGVLRVATGTVYKQAKTEKGLPVIDVAQPLKVGEVLPLESVESKVVFAPHDEQQGKMYVLPCFSQDL